MNEQRWWRTLEEYTAPSAFGEANASERHEDERPALAPHAVDRRQALALLSAAAALAAAGCERPRDEIVPYVSMPEYVVPGLPLAFATALTHFGYASPVCVESHDGHPSKIEGNPDHPASRGATDAFSQYEILSLYDPGRTGVVLKDGEIADFGSLLSAIIARRDGWQQSGGAGLRLLSGAITSPVLADLYGGLSRHFPRARWHRWQAANFDNTRKGAELAFGQRLEPLLHLDAARVVVALDDDLLGPGPRQVRHALALSQGRRARQGTGQLTRLYAVEPTVALTGASADHRLARKRSRIGAIAMALANELGAPGTLSGFDDEERAFLASLALDLKTAGGNALVTVGEAQPPEIHVIGHWINQKLGTFGRTVELIQPIEADPVDHSQSISELAADMAAGHVDTLVMVGGNPVYDAPADVEFGRHLANVSLSIRLGQHWDETSARAGWHVPARHDLESWGDAVSVDGVTSLIQPLIRPLYGGFEPNEIIDALAGRNSRSGHDMLRAFWQARANPPDMDAWWRTTLGKGFVAGTGPSKVAPPRTVMLPVLSPPPSTDFELAIHPDAAVFDGKWSENAWAQETPRPVTKLVWGNAAQLSPADATKLGVSDGDTVSLSLGTGETIEIPAKVQPGTADGAIGVPLGYGRRTGKIGIGIGVDVMPMRRTGSLWGAAAKAAKGAKHLPLLTTQWTHITAGRDLVRSMTLDAFKQLPPKQQATPTTLYPGNPRPTETPEQWAMVIDETLCIGCNACVVACQAENNVPVVGPDEMARGRDMHWLRVDTYFEGDPSHLGNIVFQPVPCMHCEKAPCEPVCPVEASVHDSEGLNVQVYNRCVGTRFCQSNCPYKVRRFNFFG
ncbi:MAG: 4Fe-4S dicluster domain-containing protein, partial [Proteobacteria bacterium]|nr:4Fe-4S dicluster domain-containing protein [Pseudomonadota bacterium]